MNLGTLTGAALSLGAAAVWGGGDFAGGIATKRANVFRVVAGAHACGLLFMVLLAWFTREPFPPRPSLWWGVVAGVTGAFGIAALYKALAIGRMGIVAPVASVITGILPVLVGIRTEGMPDRLQLAGFALALVSIWLVAPRRRNRHAPWSWARRAGGRNVWTVPGRRKAGWPQRSLLAAGGGAHRLHAAHAHHRGILTPRSPSVAPRPCSDSALRIARRWRQCAVSRRHAPRPARCRGRAVLAVSRQHGDSGARFAEGTYLRHAECRHRRRARLSRADLRALEVRHYHQSRGGGDGHPHWQFRRPDRGTRRSVGSGTHTTRGL